MRKLGGRVCRTCKGRFDLDHFIEVTLPKRGKIMACKLNYEKFGNKLTRNKGNTGLRKINPKHGYRHDSKEYKIDKWFRRKYNITLEDYNIIFESQKGCCKICGKHQLEFERRLCVDHCHVTNKIRGLLCTQCNVSLGNMNDNIELLQKAIEYLIKNK